MTLTEADQSLLKKISTPDGNFHFETGVIIVTPEELEKIKKIILSWPDYALLR